MSEHIKVGLDFIPVEERLPQSAEEVVVLVGDGRDNYIHLARYASQWFADDGKAFDMADEFRIIGWAEIPEIKRNRPAEPKEE